MQENNNWFASSIPPSPLPGESPTTSLVGLLDLLCVLEDELAGTGGLVEVFGIALTQELEEVVSHG